MDNNIEKGIEYFYKKEYNSALSCFFAALSQNLDESVNYYNVGITYEALNEKDLAKAFYEKGLKINPKDIRSLNNLAIIAKNNGDIPKYIEYLNKAIEINPNDAEAYSQFGDYYRSKKDYQMAENYYKKAARLDSSFLYNHYNLGLLYLEINEKQKAQKCFEECLKIKEDFKPVIDALKSCY